MNIETKKCKKCGEIKSLDEFAKNKQCKNGRTGTCKECVRKYKKKLYEENKEEIQKKNRQYYKENKDEILKRNKKYYEENKDKIQETKKKYTEEHKEKLAEYKHKWYLEHKEEIKESHKQYAIDNKDHIQDYQKKYRIEHKEELAEYKKQYNKNNKDDIPRKKKLYYNQNKSKFYVRAHKRSAIKKSLPNTLTSDEWNDIIEYFDGMCVLSGYSDNLSLEHFIPLSIGYGGTCIENVYPMNLSLNISKYNNNPFEWIKTQPIEYQDNFYNVLIPYLSELNNMSTEEFEMYVYYCFDNVKNLTS